MEAFRINELGNTGKEQRTIEYISSELRKIEAEEADAFRLAENESDPTRREDATRRYADVIESHKQKRAELDILAGQVFTRGSWQKPAESHAKVSGTSHNEGGGERESEHAPDSPSSDAVSSPEEVVESLDVLLFRCDKDVSLLNDLFKKRKENSLPEIHDNAIIKELRKSMETIHYKERPDGLQDALESISILVSKLFPEGDILPFDGAENGEEIAEVLSSLQETVMKMILQIGGDEHLVLSNFQKAEELLESRLP